MGKTSNIHELYIKAIENASGVPYQLDYTTGKFTFIGDKIGELLNCDFSEVSPEYFSSKIMDYNLIEPEDIFPAVNYDGFFIENNINRYKIDFKVKVGRGEFKWVNDCALPLKDPDSGEICGAIGIFQDITDRKNTEELLQSALKEKETLLKEVHHRIKNNLQIIHSLLNLQSHNRPDIEKEIFIDCKNRIRSMALVHEKLYGSDDLTNVVFNQYLDTLIREIFMEFRSELRPDINLSFNSDEVNFPIEKAISCGLIVNEAITNSLKYAFPESFKGEPKIDVELHKDNKKISLIVADNGIGFSEDVDIDKIESLGVYLIRILTKQLNGEYHLNRENGCRWKIDFSL